MINNCIASVKRRPVILIMFAFFTLIVSIVEQFNPITAKISSFDKLFKTDYLTHMSNFFNMIKEVAVTPSLLAITILFAIIFMFAAGCIFGVIGSGYFQVFYLSLFDRPSRKGEFKAGINKHFMKMALMVALTSIVTIIFVILVGFAFVPAASMLHVFMSGDSGVFYSMLLTMIITVFVMFFVIIFYIMYVSYMFPAATAFKKGGFTVAFRMVNAYCWYLLPRMLAFSLLIVILQIGLIGLGYGMSSTVATIGVIILNWVIKTLILFPYIYFVFSTFKDMKDDMFTEEE